MAVKITNWKPDTCLCSINYEWDDQTTEDERSHDLNEIVLTCSDHTGLSEQEIFDAIMHENPSKNVALGLVMDNFPALVKQVTDQDGNVTTKFIQGMEPVISFEAVQQVVSSQLQTSKNQTKSGALTPGISQPVTVNARPILFVTSGLSSQEIADCQQLMDDNLGAGVITVS